MKAVVKENNCLMIRCILPMAEDIFDDSIWEIFREMGIGEEDIKKLRCLPLMNLNKLFTLGSSGTRSSLQSALHRQVLYRPAIS